MKPLMRLTPEQQQAWDAELLRLNRLPVQGPHGPADVAGLWADPSRETRAEFLQRALDAWAEAKERQR